MPFDMDLNKKETVATPQDQELFERENGDFKELPSDIEIKPEPLAYDDEANEAGAADLIARIEQGQAVLDKAKEIEQNIATPFKEFSKQVDESAITSLLMTQNSQKEEFLRFKAMELYREMHKAAKLFLKDWCLVNNYRQRWSNPFKEDFRSGTVFVPKIYNLDIISTINQTDAKNLASMCLTARDACMEAAKKCNFDSSMHRARVFARFPKDVIEILLNNPAYLKEQRAMDIQSEHKQQIANMRFIRSDVRERWLKELLQEYRSNVPNLMI